MYRVYYAGRYLGSWETYAAAQNWIWERVEKAGGRYYVAEFEIVEDTP